MWATRDERFAIGVRETDMAWHVLASEPDDEDLAPPDRFATLREAADELTRRLRLHDQGLL